LRSQLYLIAAAMKISNDDQRAIGLIMFCIGFLCFLIGLAGHLKEDYHSRVEIASAGFTAAAILAAIGVILFLFSLRKRRG
jgi:multisubunit Na+/H+ antiporter MnhG subunit